MARQRVFEPAERLERIAAVRQRLRINRPYPERTLVALQRFLVTPQRMKRDTAIGERLGIVWLHRERTIVAGERLGGPTGAVKRNAAIVQGTHVAGIYSERAFYLLHGRFVLPALMENHAEQMQTVELVRLRDENLPVEGFGFHEPAGLMECQRLGQ